MTGEIEPKIQNRVGLLPRLAAFFIDLVLISVIFNIIGVTGQISSHMDQPGTDSLSLLEAMKAVLSHTVLAVSIFSFYLFYWMLEAIIAASPGKLLLGLQIADQSGTESHPPQLWRRYLLKNSHYFAMILALLLRQNLLLELSNLLFIILFGGYFVLIGRRQTLYDHLAKTAVFKKAAIKSEETVSPRQESHQE